MNGKRERSVVPLLAVLVAAALGVFLWLLLGPWLERRLQEARQQESRRWHEQTEVLTRRLGELEQELRAAREEPPAPSRMEEVFGEIRDEHDEATDVKEEAPGVYLMPGEVDLDRLEELFEFRRDEGAESTTVGGLVTEWLGRVPAPGEVVERGGIRLEVLEGDERRVSLVRVSRGAPAEETEALRTDGRQR